MLLNAEAELADTFLRGIGGRRWWTDGGDVAVNKSWQRCQALFSRGIRRAFHPQHEVYMWAAVGAVGACRHAQISFDVCLYTLYFSDANSTGRNAVSIDAFSIISNVCYKQRVMFPVSPLLSPPAANLEFNAPEVVIDAPHNRALDHEVEHAAPAMVKVAGGGDGVVKHELASHAVRYCSKPCGTVIIVTEARAGLGLV